MDVEAGLRRDVHGEVRFSDGDRALYAADASNYRQLPLGVCIPRSVEDIASAVRVCAEHGVPIVHRGGGTALAGQTIAPGAVVIDSSKYCNAILELDPAGRVATVEPGCVLDDLRTAAGKHGLTFGPDPSTHSHCTLGGMIGNNSCGVHALTAGRTLDNVSALEILTYDGTRIHVSETPSSQREHRVKAAGREGEIYRRLSELQERYATEIRARTPHLPRLVSGYRLEQLLPENGFNVARALVGSESTCVTVLRATVALVPDPQRVLLVAGFESLFAAADAIPAILQLHPAACEAIDDKLVGYMHKKHLHVDAVRKLPEGKAWLLIEAPGESHETAQANAQEMCARIRKMQGVRSCDIEADAAQVRALWEVRKSALGATAWLPDQPPTWPGWEDSAVPPDNVGSYARALGALMTRFGYDAAMYGHLGDGLIHMRVDFGLRSPDEVRRFRAFLDEAAQLVVQHGGSLSGEHGDGQARSQLLPIMYGDTLIRAFGEFKAIWDPQNKMNPGNIVAPRLITDDLRFGPSFSPERQRTIFSYPDDNGDFRRAALRCVGVGECRRQHGGTMCPSYRATREEKHSTRGRARLFQEMLQGSPVSQGWRSDALREALDLCLSCKGCKTECPVNVDMATYKAEFLHHHYRGRLRPRTHYAIGNIATFALLGSRLPRLANALTRMKTAKRLLGIHPERQIPRLAETTFHAMWRKTSAGGGARVVLWTDTFNNYFAPHVLSATAEVLERAGCDVELSPRGLCCGRPYYDFGLLTQARRNLNALMDALPPLLARDTHIVGVEPSCVSVFRDELVSMFPDDRRARLLRERTLMLGDFLRRQQAYTAPAVRRRILLHGHCHHKTVLDGLDADRELLEQAGASVQVLDSGCCGMAGSFGYEKQKYVHSVNIANQTLLPALRQKGTGDLIVADGFSCRSQIVSLAGLDPLTLPELLAGRMPKERAGA